MFKKVIIVCVTTVLFSLAMGKAIAAEDPIKMLQDITQNVMIKLKNNSQTLKYEPEKVYPIIDSVILPHVDFSEMARWVVGRNAWHAADNTTQDSFVNAFKTFVIKNYTRFLVKFTNEKIQFFPLREDIKNQKEIRVSSQIIKDAGSPIRMDYRLILQDDAWKVYDIVVEGVSMLEGYQAQFADQVKEGGIPAVIDEIQRHNVM